MRHSLAMVVNGFESPPEIQASRLNADLSAYGPVVAQLYGFR
jgi:hypothetical protein